MGLFHLQIFCGIKSGIIARRPPEEINRQGCYIIAGRLRQAGRDGKAMHRQKDKNEQADEANMRRCQRLCFRAWHRGIREIDLLLGRYADRHINTLTEEQLQALEHIMAYEDSDLLAFFTGEIAIPAEMDHKLFHAIAAFQRAPGGA